MGGPPDISVNSEDKSLGAAESRSELNPPRRPLGGRWASSNPVADITSFELGDLISLRPGPAGPISKSAPVPSYNKHFSKNACFMQAPMGGAPVYSWGLPGIVAEPAESPLRGLHILLKPTKVNENHQF